MLGWDHLNNLNMILKENWIKRLQKYKKSRHGKYKQGNKDEHIKLIIMWGMRRNRLLLLIKGRNRDRTYGRNNQSQNNKINK